MSNRQARREQARTSRATRTQRPAPGARRPSSGGSFGGGGGSSVFSRGFMLAIGAFVILAVAVVALVLIFNDGGDSKALVSDIEASTAALPLDMANGAKLGSDDAKVKIVTYEDFQCPFCLQYTAEQEPAIVEQLVKTGRVQLEYRHLPILKNESFTAAMAAQCAADQNKFWQYHHKLFLTQAQADQVSDEKTNVGRFSDDRLKQFASDLGLDRTKFDQCYDTKEHLDLVTQHQREANQYGITGTPGFVVNGQPLGTGTPQGIDAWIKVVESFEKAIADATATASASPSASPAATTTPAPSATATRAP